MREVRVGSKGGNFASLLPSTSSWQDKNPQNLIEIFGMEKETPYGLLKTGRKMMKLLIFLDFWILETQ